MPDEYDAELRDAEIVDYFGFNVVVGRIYGDKKQRWPDGHKVRTSVIQKTDGDIVTTLNTRYKVTFVSDKKKDLEIVIPPEMQAQLDADPDLAAAMRMFGASMRQAHADVESGKYETLEAALLAVGIEAGPVDPDEEDLPEAVSALLEQLESAETEEQVKEILLGKKQ